VNQATSSIVVTNIVTNIKATNAIATIADPTIVLKTIEAKIILNTTTRTHKAASPTKRMMIASVITSRKRATRPCIMTSPLCQMQAICTEEGVILAQDLLCALVLGLALALAAGAKATTMWLKMTASQVCYPSAGTRTPPRVMTADVFIALTRAIPFLPPSPLQLQRKLSAPRNRGTAPAENLCVPLHVFVPHREPDLLTDCTQKPSNTSNHRIAFKYDEDTVSLVENHTLSTSDILISDNFNSSAGNVSTAFEYECHEIEDDTP
jgi:hypothetical protein